MTSGELLLDPDAERSWQRREAGSFGIDPHGELAGDYLTRIRARKLGRERRLPMRIEDKRHARALAEALGVRTAPLLRTFTSPEAIDLAGLDGDLVLKPTFLSSAYGVMVLRRDGDAWWESLRRRTLSDAQIREEQRELAQHSTVHERRWIVERKVDDARGSDVPDDFKFFCFQGRVGLVHQTVRAQGRNHFAFFDGAFRPIDDPDGRLVAVNPRIVERETVPPPHRAAALAAVARRLSVAVPTPFVRVDLYLDRTGPVFGELTLIPGTFFYEDREILSPLLSRRLGRMWAMAERDLEGSAGA